MTDTVEVLIIDVLEWLGPGRSGTPPADCWRGVPEGARVVSRGRYLLHHPGIPDRSDRGGARDHSWRPAAQFNCTGRIPVGGRECIDWLDRVRVQRVSQ